MERAIEELEEILRSGEIDLAVSLLPVGNEFEWEEVRREPLVVLLPSTHPLSRKQAVSLSDLKDLPVVMFESSFAINRIILSAHQRHELEPTVVARTRQIDFSIELVATGLGITFLPPLLADRFAQPSVSRVVLSEPHMDWRLAMIWRRGVICRLRLKHGSRSGEKGVPRTDNNPFSRPADHFATVRVHQVERMTGFGAELPALRAKEGDAPE